MVKKMKKYAKFVVCMGLILGLMAPSYAALSASDGSAFVTKAEFDSALADFNARLTTFEAGINSKIDSQVTSYLDRNGIWNGKDQTIEHDSRAVWFNPIATKTGGVAALEDKLKVPYGTETITIHTPYRTWVYNQKDYGGSSDSQNLSGGYMYTKDIVLYRDDVLLVNGINKTGLACLICDYAPVLAYYPSPDLEDYNGWRPYISAGCVGNTFSNKCEASGGKETSVSGAYFFLNDWKGYSTSVGKSELFTSVNLNSSDLGAALQINTGANIFYFFVTKSDKISMRLQLAFLFASSSALDSCRDSSGNARKWYGPLTTNKNTFNAFAGPVIRTTSVKVY